MKEPNYTSRFVPIVFLDTNTYEQGFTSSGQGFSGNQRLSFCGGLSSHQNFGHSAYVASPTIVNDPSW